MDLNEINNFQGLVEEILGFINILIPALFGIVFLVVVWKVIDAWVIHGADDAKRAEGRQLLLVAVIVFVIMLSTWGIVAMLRASLLN